MRTPRRYLAPEVVQTSAMDCGPASLKCLLEGFRIGVGYDRLREACQTDVDGTSIDTMEEVARQLGLDAEQIMLPPDHLFVPEARALPAILVVANAIGVTHFVVVWRRHGPWLQVMDPAAGRLWVRRQTLLDEVYRHTLAVPAAAWKEWAGSDEFGAVLDARMAALGLGASVRRELSAAAMTDPGWHSAAALDAAVRMTAAIVSSGGLPSGRPAAALVKNVFEEELGAGAEEPIPDLYWSVRRTEPGPEGETRLHLRGAVLVRVKRRLRDTAPTGRRAGAGEADETKQAAEPLSPELAAALSEPAVHPVRELVRTLFADGLAGPLAFVAALATAAAVTVIQVLFFRGLLDVGAKLVLPEQRLTAAAALLGFLLLGTLLEVPTASRVLYFGRRLEVRLRKKFLEKTARLADRYFRSRLASDMAERSHNTHMLHEVPEIGSAMLRLVFQALFTTAGIIWLDPGVAPIALLALAVALGVPLAAQPLLAETDLRARNHAGALSRFYLDALLGLVPARNHGAERSLRREHEGLLLDWHRAALRSERAKLWFDALQALAGHGLAIWLVFRHLAGGEGLGHILLLAYWALHLQVIGEGLTQVGRQVPIYRNVTRRLLEPLGLEEAEDAAAPPPAAVTSSAGASMPGRGQGVDVRFEGVRLVAGGHVILDGIDVGIEAGSHVAVVGPSGAGKSSLMGLLLGWHQPASGQVLIDCEPLDRDRLAALRHETAWVDPAIQLWNRPLLANLCYGSRGEADQLVGAALDAALLRGLLEKLPEGLQTPLGEGGALVSGGEGQRVRLARALLRPDARLVILDEPFRGLDRSQRRELTLRARQWWPSTTLFYVSHDLAETRSFDRVLVFENGRLTEHGQPAELAAEPRSRYAALLTAEERVRRELETGAAWRRWRIDNGQLEETGLAARRARQEVRHADG